MSVLTENIGVLTHRALVMNRRVNKIASHIANLIPEDVIYLLDVGTGTGEIAQAICKLRPELIISGVDVKIRPKTFIPVVAYDGNRLPFGDDVFDAVITIDVLHHCNDPIAMLKECSRVSKKWVLIKDHISETPLDKATLRLMDWIGNRVHGVVLPYNYLSSSEWASAFNQIGLRDVRKLNQLNLYPIPFDLVFGRSLHCLHLLSK
jgi:ubiquinone/menaquinone biosynthesis C-methylase UbiE